MSSISSKISNLCIEGGKHIELGHCAMGLLCLYLVDNVTGNSVEIKIPGQPLIDKATVGLIRNSHFDYDEKGKASL